MSQQFAQWIKPHIDALVTVQSSRLGTEAELVVSLWSGVKVQVRLIDTPPKTRALKRILQEATAAGVGTLFVVAARHLPRHGQKLELPDWMQAIHDLTSDRIYVYTRNQDGQPTIVQLHFEPLSGIGKHEAVYGPAVTFERLRFFKTSSKLRAIRGDWLVADFVDPAFWKTHAYREARARADQARRRYTPDTQWRTWSGYQTWEGVYEETASRTSSSHAQSESAPLRDYLAICCDRLGVSLDADRQTVRDAYRRLAMQVHPDVSSLPKAEAELRFKAISEAYEYIKAANHWA